MDQDLASKMGRIRFYQSNGAAQEVPNNLLKSKPKVGQSIGPINLNLFSEPLKVKNCEPLMSELRCHVHSVFDMEDQYAMLESLKAHGLDENLYRSSGLMD